MLKRVISILMVLSILIGASACNGGGKKEDDFSMTNTPSYEEKEIGEALGLQYCGQKIGLDSKDQIILSNFSEGKGISIIVADGTGKKVQEYKNDIAGENMFTLDAQDNRYALNASYSERKEEDKNWEATYAITVYNSQGEKQKSFDLGKRTFSKIQQGITDIVVDSKGNIYLLIQNEKIEVIDATGKKVKEIPVQKATEIEIDEGDNLFIGYTKDGTNYSSIEKRSLEKEDSIWKKDFTNGNIMRNMRYSLKDKTLYILTDSGILSCSSDGDVNGYIFSLKQSSLLESGIYIQDIAFDISKNIYVLASKNDLSTNKFITLLYKYTPIKGEQKTQSKKTLTVAVRGSERYLEAAVGKFEKEHPDIKVDVKVNFQSDNYRKEEEEYQKVISTELMAGNGADIIEIQDLPYKKFVDKNMLANLSEMIKNDKSFDISKYQQNVVNACKYRDNLYMIPIQFSFVAFMANKNIMTKENLKIDSTKWTWKEFLEIAQKISKDTNGDGKLDQFALPKMSASEIFNFMFTNEYNNFVDFDNKKANFDSKEFIEILNFAKDFPVEKICSPTLDWAGLYNYTDPGTVGFIRHSSNGYDNCLTQGRAQVNGEVEFLDMPSFGGGKGLKSFLLGRAFSINNNSKLKAESWELIKVLLSDEIQSSRDFFRFGVNLNSQKDLAKLDMARGAAYYADRGRYAKPLTQEDIDLVNKVLDGLNTIPYYDIKANTIISEGANEFFTGKKTAEEAAKQIQNKMNIYLGE